MKTFFKASVVTTLFLSACTGSRTKLPEDTLTLTLGDDIRYLDPGFVNDVPSAEIVGHIFEGLLQFDYSSDLQKLVPLLAKALPTVSADKKVYTFEIRDDVFFQDAPQFANGKGRKVEARDFVYAVKRLAAPEPQSPNAWLVLDVVQGLRAWREKLSKIKDKAEYEKVFQERVPGLVALAPNKIEFRLEKAFPQFLYILAMTPLSAVAEEVISHHKVEAGNHPVGTGPYKLQEWVRGSRITLVRNENFTRHNIQIPKINWDIIKEEQPRWLKFLAGELDMIRIPNDFFSKAIGADGKLLPSLADKGYTLHRELNLTTWWITFNLADPVLGSNKKLRQALSLAFNKARALELLENNRGMLVSDPLPTQLRADQETQKDPWTFDLERAKMLIKESGVDPKKTALTIDLRGPGVKNRQMGELLRDQWKQLGFEVNLVANAFQEALEKERRSKFQMMMGGWAADYPDAENFVQLFTSKNKAPGPNASNFSNREYDELYEKIRVLTPSPERQTQIKRMLQILQEELPVIFYFQSLDYIVTHPRLKGYMPHPLYFGATKHYAIDSMNKKK